jgi:hypothetical protein
MGSLIAPGLIREYNRGGNIIYEMEEGQVKELRRFMSGRNK